MRKTLAAAGLGLALVLTGCGQPAAGELEESEGIEFEDCDYEDALKSERECSKKQIADAKAKKKASTTKKSKSSSSKTKTKRR